MGNAGSGFAIGVRVDISPARRRAVVLSPQVWRRLARPVGWGVASSGVLAALQLSAPLSMLAIYESVLPTGDVLALFLLMALVAALHGLFVLIDIGRGRALCREGLAFAHALERHALTGYPGDRRGADAAVIRDAERIGHFFTGTGPPALFDALWLPGYLAVVFILHPLLALFAAGGGLALVGLAFAAERRSCKARRAMSRLRRNRHAAGEMRLDGGYGLLRTAELWMAFERRRRSLSRSYYRMALRVARRSVATGAGGKGVRLVLQSAAFGLGALLVINGALSPGQLFVSSLIVGRILATLDAALAQWSRVCAAHASYVRLSAYLLHHGSAAGGDSLRS